MSDDRWRESRRIAEQALELEPKARREFVSRETMGQEYLRPLIEQLLAGDQVADRFLMVPAEEHRSDESDPGLVGETVGEFEIVRMIGRGGTGVVLEAKQVGLGRRVALKILHAPHSLLKEQVRRFGNEARTAADLDHPGIVSIYSVGQDRGFHYFAMEFVEGNDLASILSHLRGEGSLENPQLPPFGSRDYIGRVVELMIATCDALGHAHMKGVIHRDIKPQNLILSRAGGLKVVDFGIAKNESFEDFTRTGEILGSPAYMSAEQVLQLEDADLRLDPRTDIFSLGVVLFELLTLRRPFDGQSLQAICSAIRVQEPPALRKLNDRIPQDLETICLRMLEKDRDVRFQSAAELSDDLARFLAHEAISSRRPGFWRRAQRSLKRRMRSIVFGILLVALVATSYAFAGRRAQQATVDVTLGEVRSSVERLARLGSIDAVDLRDLRVDLGFLERNRPLLDASGGGLIERGRQLVADYRAVMIADISRRFAIKPSQAGAEASALEGMRMLGVLQLVFPDDEELEELRRQAVPRMRVSAVGADGRTVTAEVYMRSINPLLGGLGKARLIGTTPIKSEEIEPGYYRIIVRFSDDTFVELSRYVAAGPSRIQIEARHPGSRDQDATRLVRISGAALEIRGDEKSPCHLKGSRVGVEDFLIEEHEVSNAQYRAFCLATGHEQPRLWCDAYDHAWDEFPVTTIGWNDAQAYAEWVGRRLPTHAEWMLAARGVEWRRFPWGNTFDGEGNASVPIDGVWKNQSERRDFYLAAVQGVRSHPEARTPEGLYHMYGNVEEFTESMHVERMEDSPVALRWRRIVLGGTWHGRKYESDLSTHGQVHGLSSSYGRRFTGFRCARSVDPLDQR